MDVVKTFEEVRASRGVGTMGLVPTMGYLHEGHLSLAVTARTIADRVVMTLFVNPLQFGTGEDLDTYPRDFDRDAALAESAGVDVLFAPDLGEMYPSDPVVTVDVGSLASTMEGVHRPGHFEGVATAVTKLLAGTQPHAAVFGKKDAQQLAIVKRLVTDLSLPVEIVGSPTIREESGLALSSRNVYLTDEERIAAAAINRGLSLAADAAEAGETAAATLEQIVIAETGDEPLLDLEYVTLASVADCAPVSTLDDDAFLATAVRIGRTRLIDNVHLDVGSHGVVADRGVRLGGPSVLEEAH